MHVATHAHITGTLSADLGQDVIADKVQDVTPIHASTNYSHTTASYSATGAGYPEATITEPATGKQRASLQSGKATRRLSITRSELTLLTISATTH